MKTEIAKDEINGVNGANAISHNEMREWRARSRRPPQTTYDKFYVNTVANVNKTIQPEIADNFIEKFRRMKEFWLFSFACSCSISFVTFSFALTFDRWNQKTKSWQQWQHRKIIRDWLQPKSII